MNRGRYAYMGLWVKYAFVKSSGVSKNHTSAVKKPEKTRFSVSNRKIIRLRLQSYTLRLILGSWTESNIVNMKLPRRSILVLW